MTRRVTRADLPTLAPIALATLKLTEPQGDDVRYVTNAEPIVFPAYQADADAEVRYAFLSRDQAGGEAIWADVVDRPRLPLRGDMVIFPAGSFRIGVP